MENSAFYSKIQSNKVIGIFMLLLVVAVRLDI